MSDTPESLSTALLLQRQLQYTTFDFNNTSAPITYADVSSAGNGRDAYEFVAFLLWYLFLVLCCVIPTCCAYRRRRLVEARIAQQQASVNRIERQNLFILSSLRQSSEQTERIREQRGRKITETLKETTVTVEEQNIVPISGDENEAVPRDTVVISQGSADDTINNTTDNNPQPMPTIEYDVEALEDADNTHLLQITTHPGEDPKSFPGACAICLCPYETTDEVTWSPKEACQHLFHTACITEWLAKADDEPKCPCCRQAFCDPVELELEPQVHVVDPQFRFFGPSFHTLGDERDSELVIPHFMRTLEASRLEFLASLEMATMEASGITNNSSATTIAGQAAANTAAALATTTTTPLDGSLLEGASEEGEVTGSGNSAIEVPDGSPFEIPQAAATTTPAAAEREDGSSEEAEVTGSRSSAIEVPDGSPFEIPQAAPAATTTAAAEREDNSPQNINPS